MPKLLLPVLGVVIAASVAAGIVHSKKGDLEGFARWVETYRARG